MPITSFKASGYTKHRDAKAEPQAMTIETQKHVDPSKGADKKVGLIVRIGVEPKPGDRALDDLAEYSITLTLSQATFFAAAIMTEVGQIQQVLDKRLKKED